MLDTIGDYTDKSILDLGCGIGCFAFELAEKAKKVVGIDIPDNENGLLVFSQVHPISTASLGESSWVTDNNQLKFQLDNYCNVSKRKRVYFDGTFDFYHRGFEELINIAIKNGFSIEELYEPYVTEKEYNRPSFLIVKLQKR